MGRLLCGAGPHSPALVLLGWLAARVLVGLVYLSLDFSTRPLAWGDLALYEYWADEIARTGAMPDNVTWMYPPLAAFVLLLADVLPGPYGTTFVLLMLACDLDYLLLLLAEHRRGTAHPAGMWAWVVLVPLLGTISWSRLDLVPVVFAAAALLLAARRPLLAGVMAGLGTAAKGWPVVLGLLFLRDRRWLAGAVAAGLVVAVVSTLLLGDTWSFLATCRAAGSGSSRRWPCRGRSGGYGGPGSTAASSTGPEILEPGAAVLARVATALMLGDRRRRARAVAARARPCAGTWPSWGCSRRARCCLPSSSCGSSAGSPSPRPCRGPDGRGSPGGACPPSRCWCCSRASSSRSSGSA